MSDNDLIRRGDARHAVIQSTGTMDAVANINAIPADPRVAKLVEAWRGVRQHPGVSISISSDDARHAWNVFLESIAAWEAGK